MARDELKEYRKLIGSEAYKKLYNYLYLEGQRKKGRFSGKKYENPPEKLNQIKEKYKNGVSKETMSFNQCTVNPKWFMSLKAEIESYLKGYAWKNYIAFDWVLQTNRVNITGERLEITNQTKDVVYMTVDFCPEFMPSSVLISVNY